MGNREAESIVERVQALTVQPGDIVVFMLRENATEMQIHELAETLAQSLPPSITDAQFIGARCIEGIKVVRAEGGNGQR